MFVPMIRFYPITCLSFYRDSPTMTCPFRMASLSLKLLGTLSLLTLRHRENYGSRTKRPRMICWFVILCTKCVCDDSYIFRYMTCKQFYSQCLKLLLSCSPILSPSWLNRIRIIFYPCHHEKPLYTSDCVCKGHIIIVLFFISPDLTSKERKWNKMSSS